MELVTAAISTNDDSPGRTLPVVPQTAFSKNFACGLLGVRAAQSLACIPPDVISAYLSKKALAGVAYSEAAVLPGCFLRYSLTIAKPSV